MNSLNTLILTRGREVRSGWGCNVPKWCTLHPTEKTMDVVTLMIRLGTVFWPLHSPYCFPCVQIMTKLGLLVLSTMGLATAHALYIFPPPNVYPHVDLPHYLSKPISVSFVVSTCTTGCFLFAKTRSLEGLRLFEATGMDSGITLSADFNALATEPLLKSYF
jgi:hypothetical protein